MTGGPTGPVVFIPQTTEFGGAEIHLTNLVRALAPSTCVIWYYPDDVFSAHLAGLPHVQTAPRPGRISRWSVLSFWSALRKMRPGIVVFVKGIADVHPWYGYLAARLSGARKVLAIEHSIADPPPPATTRRGLAGWVSRQVGWRQRYLFRKALEGRLIHLTVCVSEAVRRRLVQEYHYPGSHTTTLYCGVDLAHFRPEFRNRSDGQIPLIVCAARLHPAKRIDLLLEALAGIRSSIPWRCTIVGGGRSEAALRNLASRLGVTASVEFTGHVGDVRPYLRRATILVLPSDKEGLPLSIVEAMAMGVPCVATDVGGTREIVLQGKTGLLVDPGDRQALTQAIEHLLVHGEERKRMGEEGLRLVSERFDARKSMDRYRALLT